MFKEGSPLANANELALTHGFVRLIYIVVDKEELN